MLSLKTMEECVTTALATAYAPETLASATRDITILNPAAKSVAVNWNAPCTTGPFAAGTVSVSQLDWLSTAIVSLDTQEILVSILVLISAAV